MKDYREMQPIDQMNHRANSEVELQIEILETSEITKVEPIDEVASSNVGDTEQLTKPQLYLAASKQRWQIKTWVRYDHTYITYD